MQTDYLALMRKLAPDLTDEIARRAMILERIYAMQPVGRRQLAQRLHLPEREIRNTAGVLRDLGYVEQNASGLTVSPRAEEILEAAGSFAKAMSGLNAMELELESLLPVELVMIVSGNADEEPRVLNDAGRACAGKLRTMLQNGKTLAVTGGRSIAAVVRNLQTVSPLNVMVVPARGGMGHSVELQANTLAEEAAARLGGHYRLIHLPDHLDMQALHEMLKMPEISEAVEFLQRADIILHGIGKASETMRERRLDRAAQSSLRRDGAVGECFGAYYNLEGRCLLESSGIGVDLARLKPTCRMIAVAAGAGKAGAIISVLRHKKHAMLVTDEGAAEEMLRLLRGPDHGEGQINQVALPERDSQ